MSFSSVYSQVSILGFPEKYILPKDDLSLYTIDEKIGGKPWIVYTVNHQTSSKYKDYRFVLHPFQKYYVVEETNRKLHIIGITKDVQDSVQLVKLNESHYNDFGWVLKSDMLLWQHSLVNENNIPIRVFIKENDQGYGSVEPFMYVYYKNADTVLLGLKEYFNDLNIENHKSFFKKIPKNLVVYWDNNLSLQINKSKYAIEQREKKKLPFVIYDNVGSLKEFLSTGLHNNKGVYWTEDFTQDKKNDTLILNFPFIKYRRKFFESGVLIISNNQYHFKELYFLHQHDLLDMSYVSEDVLITKQKLGEIIRIYDQILNTKDLEDPRKSLLEVYLNIARKKLPGQKISEKSFINDINYKVLGYKTNNILNPYQLIDLLDEEKIPQHFLSAYYVGINIVYENLTRVFNSDEIDFYSGGTPYYWIEKKLLW